MKSAIASCALCLLISVGASAQTPRPDPSSPPPLRTPESARFQVGFGGLIGVPRGEFGDNVDVSGGFSGDFGYRVGETPVSLGGNLGVLFYGRRRRRVPLTPTLPDVPVDVITRNNMLLMHGRVRVQPRRGPVRPYADGLLGFSYLFTQTTVETNRGGFGDDTLASVTNLDDFTVSYGAGAGVMLDLTSWAGGRLALDAGLRYLAGGKADYLVEGSLVRPDGSLAFDVIRSRTDLVAVQLGLAVDF